MKKSLFILLACACITGYAHAQTPAAVGSKWLTEMIAEGPLSSNSNFAIKNLAELRAKYNSDKQAMLEMSWEERDNIWKSPHSFQLNDLARRYKRAYVTSCNERGVIPAPFDTVVNDLPALLKVRSIYLASRKAEYVILTPKAPRQPLINSAAVYGVRPGHDIIYRIAATGLRPMTFSVEGLPAGCVLNKQEGIISGRISKAGNYSVMLNASNVYGKARTRLIIRVGDQIALTPPMGWNSWNSFASDVTSKDIRNTVDELVNTSLVNYGWSYVNIDDCWMKLPELTAYTGDELKIRETYYKARVATRQKNGKTRFDEKDVTGTSRDASGAIISNKDFSDMPGLTQYIHQKGLKAGIYISPGPLTCQGYEGSYGHEAQDAKRFAAWGFDYLKYDWCGYRNIIENPTVNESIAPYRLMGQELKKVDRDILYSLCQYGKNDVWKWGESVDGNAWRTTGDIRDNWESVQKLALAQAGLEKYSGPGHWNDPDMLVVGYVGWSKNLRPTYLSPNEQYSHITLWSMLSSPLLIGCDLTRLDDFTFSLLSNPEVIAINQDVAGKQAALVSNQDNIQVWSRTLADGSTVVGVFNTGETPIKYPLHLSALQLYGKYQLRDLWKQQNAGMATGTVNVPLNRHAVKLYKLTAVK